MAEGLPRLYPLFRGGLSPMIDDLIDDTDVIGGMGRRLPGRRRNRRRRLRTDVIGSGASSPRRRM